MAHDIPDRDPIYAPEADRWVVRWCQDDSRRFELTYTREIHARKVFKNLKRSANVTFATLIGPGQAGVLEHYTTGGAPPMARPVAVAVADPGPDRRWAIGPHAAVAYRPLEPGEAVEVVNEGDGQAGLVAVRSTERATIAGALLDAEKDADKLRAERDAARAVRDAANAEAKVLREGLEELGAALESAKAERDALLSAGLDWLRACECEDIAPAMAALSVAYPRLKAEIRRVAGLDAAPAPDATEDAHGPDA